MRKGGFFYLRNALLGIFVLFLIFTPFVQSQIFSQDTLVAHAGTGTLPAGDVMAAISQNASEIIDDLRSSTLFGKAETDALGDYMLTLTDVSNPSTNANDFINKLVNSQITGNVYKWKNHIGATNNWTDTYHTVYNDTYIFVGNLDSSWNDFLNNNNNKGINYLYDAASTNFPTSSTTEVADFNKAVDSTLAIVDQKILPNLAGAKGGNLTVNLVNQALHTLAKTDPSVQTEITNMADFDALAIDLDVASGVGGKTNTQSQRLRKRFNYVQALTSGRNAGDVNDSMVYKDLLSFYNDMAMFTNDLLAAKSAGINSDVEVKNLQSKLMADAVKMDATAGTNTNVPSGRCGVTPDWKQIGQNILVAFCSVADIGQQWTKDLLASSVAIMAQTAGLAGASQASTFLPKELSGDIQGLFVDSTNPFAMVLRNVTHGISIFLDTALVLFFVVIAFANIFQIQVTKYSVSKLLPAIVMGFIVAQFSVFAVRVSLEAVSQLSSYVLTIGVRVPDPSNPGQTIPATSLDFSKPYNDLIVSISGDQTVHLTTGSGNNELADPSKIFAQLIRNALVLAAAIMIFILGFLFVIRSVVFFFITPLAPLAFFSAFVPPLSSLWSRWSKLFSSWLAMPLVSMFWLWLGFLWLNAIKPLQVTGSTSFLGVISFPILLSYGFALLCIYLAMKTPFSMAGEAKMVLDKWNGMGKKAWSNTGGKALKSTGQWAAGEVKLRVGQTAAANKVRDFKAWQKRRDDRVKTAWETGVDVMSAEKRAHKLKHMNDDKASLMADKLDKEAESVIAAQNGETARVEQLKKEIEKLDSQIEDVDKEIVALDKWSLTSKTGRKNAKMLKRLGQNINRTKKEALEHQVLKEMESTAELRLADFNHEYQERYDLSEESKGRAEVASERLSRVNKQNFEGMTGLQYEPERKLDGSILRDAENKIVYKKDAKGNRIPLKDPRTGLQVGKEKHAMQLARIRVDSREEAKIEKYTAEKLESDRIKAEARETLLATKVQPSKDEDYAGYQRVERALDIVREENTSKSTTALSEVYSKPFPGMKSHDYKDDSGTIVRGSAHMKILAGKITITEEQRRNNDYMKGLQEASGHLRGMADTIGGKNSPGDVRQAAQRLLEFTPDNHKDRFLYNMAAYGSPDQIKDYIRDGKLSISQAKEDGLIKKQVQNVDQITDGTVNFDDTNFRKLASMFGKSYVAQRAYKITKDRADVFNGRNYDLDENTGVWTEKDDLK